jgi:SAM-dependent methyltransferase
VGLQWQSGESYRDYPHNLELLRLLTTRCDVALFGARHSHDPGIEGVHVISRPLREAFALAAQCDVLIGPDSAFLHLAAALDKPMVLLSGPVDGMLRSKPYPTVVPIVPDRSEFPCAPCWRNENINCYLSERRESVCLRSIEPATITARVFSLLEATPIALLTMHNGPDAADAPPGAPTHSQPLEGERMARKIATPPAAAVQCKVCGSPVREVFRLPSSKQTGQPMPNSADDCPYYECRRCHFLFATLHDWIDHTTLYDETYWKTQDPDWYGRVSETLRLVLLSQSFLDIAPWWLRVLDFGCGMGTFVEVARRQLQMQVWGTDIIEPRFGREWFVRSGDIAAAQFDVIVACEVIEHLTDPVGLFDQIKRWLKRGGVFAFQTAYYDPGACGRDWWYIGPANGHVSLYSARSFDVLAKRLGARRRASWNNYPGLQAWQF